jgi:hypothetical protein
LAAVQIFITDPSQYERTEMKTRAAAELWDLDDVTTRITRRLERHSAHTLTGADAYVCDMGGSIAAILIPFLVPQLRRVADALERVQLIAAIPEVTAELLEDSQDATIAA